MAAAHWLSRYIGDIDDIREAGNATELSYRTPIEQMLQEAAAEFDAKVNIRQEPGRTKSIGAPDFLISAKDGGGVVGYVECKAPGADLQKQTTKAQVEKYRALSENILLTDSFRWLHLREGKTAADVQLAKKPDKRKREEFAKVLREFMITPAEEVADSKRLAQTLARRCVILRDGLAMHEDNKESRLHGLLKEFRQTLDRNLDFAHFADFFAQTLIYSLLMAKLNSAAGEPLALENLRGRIPQNFAVIRNIAIFLTELDDNEYNDIRWIVGDILAIINGMDRVAIAETMSYKKGIGESDDPYLNFYETFLAEYDPKLRESRGVYYTPPPVVKFIVRAADDLLRRDFNMPDGLAQGGDEVVALDFAAGTGTFMLEMARLLFGSTTSKGKRDILAREHFLKKFHGFEMMASAYVISHLKLSRFLADNDIHLKDNERIQVYLANTLEKIDKQIELSLMRSLEREAKAAQKVKDSPVLVIVGNPPYSGHSQNKGKWIKQLLHGKDDGKEVGGSYYQVDGEPLGERTIKWLQDDYVKFIRFAQRKMDMVERGIVAVITNHGFLDNPTFRGMRQSLINTFDALYFLDLHGNSKKKEKTPDGGKDENVFDIQQGVAISLLVKNPNTKKKGVFHADLWGARKKKYEECIAQSVESVNWRKLDPASPFYLFVPRNKRLAKMHDKFYSVKDIFALDGVGIVTAHDNFVMDFDKSVLRRRFEDFQASENNAAQLHEKFNVAYKNGWDIMRGKKALANQKDMAQFIKPIYYRPFDIRHIFYEDNLVWRTVRKVMSQMLATDNLGLISVRQVAEKHFNHAIVADKIIDSRMTISNKGGAYFFPLYRYENGMGDVDKRENFSADFRQWIDKRYGKAHTPEDIFGCIYAVLHSPDYRKRYADFLRTDFPRIPFPESNDKFERLATIGNELVAAHLLRENCNGKYGELCGDGTSHKVEKVRYDEDGGRLYFNKAQYFNIPPEVFNFQIGGYKPLDKYLKSRKGRKLSLAEATNIKQTANAIAFTIAKMREIDKIDGGKLKTPAD